MSFEQLFASSVLDLVIPTTSVPYPPTQPTDEWLQALNSGNSERKTAFFDEQLQSFLTVHIEHPPSTPPPEQDNPPQIILTFLAHLQVSLEATYISSVPVSSHEPLKSSRLSAPPRTTSKGAGQAGAGAHLGVQSHHPSILPPKTPNPTPASATQDQKYVNSEGTLLLAMIWGQNSGKAAENSNGEAFSLLWSDEEEMWVAVYRLSLTVSFLRLAISDPLLCLTVSATLREKPLALTQASHPLGAYLKSVGSQLLADPESPTSPGYQPEVPEQQTFDGLEEANLLAGLLGGMTFGKGDQKDSVYLPTTRLGTVSRQKLFSLPPVSLPILSAPTPSPMTAVRTAHPTLRKSYRKTMQAVSGFRVRMRTVFVPYVLLPAEMEQHLHASSNSDDDEEKEEREAGNEEKTVVLCVEIENSGESGYGVGFMVEKVNVKIGGEGATATLIGWGEGSFKAKAEEEAFPLRVGSMAQYNLLYAVTFLHAPDEIGGFSLAKDVNNPEKLNQASAELTRAVSIDIFGKPYSRSRDSGSVEEEEYIFPTNTFSSRWNCVLDLSAQQRPLSKLEGGEGYPPEHQALPEPASPFPPANTPRTSGFLSPYGAGSGGGPYSGGSTPNTAHTAGSKRHTVPGVRFARPTTPNQNRPMSLLNPASANRPGSPSGGGNRLSYLPPSLSAQPPRSPTTYGAPYGAPPGTPPQAHTEPSYIGHSHTGAQSLEGLPPSTPMPLPPRTPAYPSYPPLSAIPPSPLSSQPITSSGTGNVGPSVEIRRERGVGMQGTPIPQTPGPWVTSGFNNNMGMVQRGGPGGPQTQQPPKLGESIVVSVGLLPLLNRAKRKSSKADVVLGPGKIYPLDRFTLDIFVYNQSDWTRRFEVTCPDTNNQRERERRRRSQRGVGKGSSGAKRYPGILPMDARVRIGPLLPSACQSVRMDFLAISPGVHSVDTLTLTDIETGFAMNLRSVMDVVVHDPSD